MGSPKPSTIPDPGKVSHIKHHGCHKEEDAGNEGGEG